MAKTTTTENVVINEDVQMTVGTVDTRDKFIELERELNNYAYERKDVIRGSIIALLTKTNMLQLGAPGAAKSYITRKLAQSINCDYFQYLLGKNTTPDELFGPVSLKGLTQDKYERITDGRAAACHIYFADEIFKGSSAIINANLTLINEHIFDAGRGMLDVPLQSCFGASNELPEANSGLDAMLDRFLLRYWVDYISDNNNFASMLMGNNGDVTTEIDLQELFAAQKEVRAVTVNPDSVKAILKIKSDLETKNIIVSDRRYKEAVKLIKAQAWLAGRNKTNVRDVTILQDVLWYLPEQIEEVRRAVKKHTTDANVFRADQIVSELRDKMKGVDKTDKVQIIEVYNIMEQYVDELKKLYIKTGGSVSEGQSGMVYASGNDEILDLINETRGMYMKIRELSQKFKNAD